MLGGLFVVPVLISPSCMPVAVVPVSCVRGTVVRPPFAVIALYTLTFALIVPPLYGADIVAVPTPIPVIV